MKRLYGFNVTPREVGTVSPQVASGSRFKPYVPPQMEADFDAYLMTDVPHVNWWFARYTDWFSEEETQEQIRGEVYPINWKSKYSGSDTASNFRVSQKTAIAKGDILVREDGEILMIIWNVENQVNNKTSQVQTCNLISSFERYRHAEVDGKTGKLIRAAGQETIVEDIPLIAYEVANKQEFGISYNVPGIVPNHIGTVLVQQNQQTKNLLIGDEFEWHGTRFHITDIGFGELDITGTSGMMTLYVEKTAGEDRG